jgi:arginine-tRNA-protein transferase
MGVVSAEPQYFSHYPAAPPPVSVPLVTIPQHPCSYLSDRQTSIRAAMVRRISPGAYQQFMDAGFRRSGLMLYQPVCGHCRQCVPLRVLVGDFRPNKAQRRCWRRNQDLQVIAGAPQPDLEKFQLYTRYLRNWHGRSDADSFGAFVDFLYTSPVHSIEFTHRDAAGRLVAVGICDLTAEALSSVYCYFDPDLAARSPGTYAALREIDYARSIGARYYYLGYWVDQCGSMVYKSSFRPNELLGTDGIWRRVASIDRDRTSLAQ